VHYIVSDNSAPAPGQSRVVRPLSTFMKLSSSRDSVLNQASEAHSQRSGLTGAEENWVGRNVCPGTVSMLTVYWPELPQHGVLVPRLLHSLPSQSELVSGNQTCFFLVFSHLGGCIDFLQLILCHLSE
jgi:hypothetical protein